LPEPAKRDAKAASAANQKPPAAPSTRTVEFNGAGIRLRHPDNWKATADGNHAAIAPDGGSIGGNLAYGVIVDVFQRQGARELDQATSQLLNELKRRDSGIQMTGNRSQTRVDGRPAVLTELSNTSPAGGQETDYVITVSRSSTDLLYFVLVAPTK